MGRMHVGIQLIIGVAIAMVLQAANRAVGEIAEPEITIEYDRFYDSTTISMEIPVDDDGISVLVLSTTFPGKKRPEDISEAVLTVGPYAVYDSPLETNIRFLVDGERYDCMATGMGGNMWAGILRMDRVVIIGGGESSEFKIGEFEVSLSESNKISIQKFVEACTE